MTKKEQAMNVDSSSFEQQQLARARRRISIRRLLNRDKTPLAILLAATVVGTLAGLVGVAFEKAVNSVLNWRIGVVSGHADSGGWVWVWAFGLSALFAMAGYFLVRKFAPEAGGSGIPEIEGALEELRPVRWWRVIPVKFIGGMGTLGAGMVLGREGPTVSAMPCRCASS
jgi:CIC family chloride channel protein